MGLYLKNTKLGGLTVTNEIGLDTYDADITPENMQHGTSAYAKGKKVIGTGKAFAFAEYGSKLVKAFVDSNGIERYGFACYVGENTNIVFVAPSTTGDIILQTEYKVSINAGEETSIAENNSTGGKVKAFYDKDRVIVYFTDFSQKRTIVRIFIGKDNALL